MINPIAAWLGTMPTTLVRRLMGSFAERRLWPPADFVYIAADLAAPLFSRQITAQLPLAVALVYLRIQDFGSAHQGVDLLLQLLLGPEHPLMAHGLVLGGIGLNLMCHPAPHGPGSPSRPSAEAQDLNEQAEKCRWLRNWAETCQGYFMSRE